MICKQTVKKQCFIFKCLCCFIISYWGEILFKKFKYWHFDISMHFDNLFTINKKKHTIFLTCQIRILSFNRHPDIQEENPQEFWLKFFKVFLYYFFRDLNPRSAKVEKRQNTRVQVYLRAFSVPEIGSNLSRSQNFVPLKPTIF